jgi:hypothetical protein
MKELKEFTKDWSLKRKVLTVGIAVFVPRYVNSYPGDTK